MKVKLNFTDAACDYLLSKGLVLDLKLDLLELGDILSFKLSILSFIALYQKVCTVRTTPRALRYESNRKTLSISTLPDSYVKLVWVEGDYILR